MSPALSQHWNHFWFRTAPPHPLALLRIAFGAFLLLYWGMQWRGVPLRFSSEGLVIPSYEPSSALTLLFTPPPAWVARLLFCVLLSVLLLFMLGFLARVASAVACLLCLYYWQLSLHVFGTSYDHLFLFFLLVFSFSGSDKAFSLSMVRKHGSFLAWEPASILPQRLLAAQITATYLGVGLQKLILPAWQGGEVLAWGFAGRWATPLATGVIRRNWPLSVYDAAVFLVKSVEIALPIALWVRRLRPLAIIGGALFHISIALFLGIWWFLALIPSYILFFEPEDVERWVSGRME